MRRIRQNYAEAYPSSITFDKMVNQMTKIALVGFSPLILMGVFWVVDIQNSRLVLLPLLGVLCLIIGGIVAIVFSKVLKLKRIQTGAMFTSGSFSN